MAKELINIVWLKRDLRTQDHAPLSIAESCGLPYLVIYCFEPQFLERPDSSLRHHQFVYHSIEDLNKTWKGSGREVQVFHGNAEEVFPYLLKTYKIHTVLSHRESGTQATWDRDKRVHKLLNKKGGIWREFQRDGILRGISDRDGWDKEWYATMSQSTIQNQYTSKPVVLENNPFPLSKTFKEALEDYPENFQPPGEQKAWKYLHSFTDARGFDYYKHISKPKESRTTCSRLSPYLAWGNLSIKQAVRFVKFHPNYEGHKRAFQGMMTRLKWHCHFIQKFEVECRYETECINRGYELLERDTNPTVVSAWKEGKTGYPLVDANMRCVKETGWINFRMRAMVVSFLCHHLDQDWREGSYHLAQQFLDYEPGIHYPQFQMQAGTTGINTVRMYNPVKQSQDHDAEGVFIKKWVPELERLPIEYLHEPWRIPPLEQAALGFQLGVDYPEPLVDLTESGKKARAKIWGHRKHPEVQAEKYRILKTHTRKNRPAAESR